MSNITSRDVIREANRRYLAGIIDDAEFIRVVDPVASYQARFLLHLVKARAVNPDWVDAVDAAYRVIEDREDTP